MGIRLFISGEEKQKNQVTYLKDKMTDIKSRIKSDKKLLKEVTSRIEHLEKRKGEIAVLLNAVEAKQSSIKKAQNRARYLVRKHDFLTLEYDDYDYWIESSSPVHMDEDGQWDEDSDYYIDAGMRHVHVQPDNSHWLDIVEVCERIVNDVMNMEHWNSSLTSKKGSNK